MLFFFFSSRRRHTRYWRDWSSDVCSSDLLDAIVLEVREIGEERHLPVPGRRRGEACVAAHLQQPAERVRRRAAAARLLAAERQACQRAELPAGCVADLPERADVGRLPAGEAGEAVALPTHAERDLQALEQPALGAGLRVVIFGRAPVPLCSGDTGRAPFDGPGAPGAMERRVEAGRRGPGIAARSEMGEAQLQVPGRRGHRLSAGRRGDEAAGQSCGEEEARIRDAQASLSFWIGERRLQDVYG